MASQQPTFDRERMRVTLPADPPGDEHPLPAVTFPASAAYYRGRRHPLNVVGYKKPEVRKAGKKRASTPPPVPLSTDTPKSSSAERVRRHIVSPRKKRKQTVKKTAQK